MTPGTKDMEPPPQITKILVLGESHSLPFDGLAVDHASSGQTVHVQAHFLPKVIASNVSTDNSDLHPHLREVLQPAGAKTGSGAPSNSRRPPIVLSFGDVEIHTKLLIRMAETYDFELPDRPDLPIRPMAEAVPLSTVTSFLESIFSPLRRGIRIMRENGFEEIIIHGLPARAECDERASYWTRSTICPLATRLKVTQHANALLNAISDEQGVHFINVWAETSEAGILHKKYDLDGVHTTTEAARISINKISDLLFPHDSKTQ